MTMSNSPRHYTLQFSDRHFAQMRRILVAVLLIATSVTIIVLLRDLITPVVVSVFSAYLLAPLVDTVENRGLSRTWAVIVVFLFIFMLLGLAITFLWPKMLEELQNLIAGLQANNPEQLIEGIKKSLKASFPGMAKTSLIDKLVEAGVKYAEAFINRTTEGFIGFFSAIGEIIIIPFLTFFILKDSRSLKKNIVQRIPNRYFEMTLSLIHKATLQLGRFIRGQVLDATIVGVMAMIALSLLDLRYALLIGALAGMANVIPFLGPLVGGVPAVLVAIVDKGSIAAALPVVAAFAVVKLIDDVIVQPLVVSKSVQLHPATVIISIFAGGHIAGVLGMIMAVPMVSMIKVTIGILYWGFTKYHIFSPPPFALAAPQATVEVLAPTALVEPAAPAPAPSSQSFAETKKSPVNTAKRSRHAKDAQK
jgi:predicted PurR-regulated permease PerM